MIGPITRKTPAKSDGFSWGRFPMGDTGVVAYRLFRRDCRGALHTLSVDMRAGDERSAIAASLRRARRSLRDQVDEIDLEAMGVAA
jgi:hypothetical protein